MNPDEKLVEATQRNAAALIAEMEWFSQVLDVRMRLHFGESSDYQEVFDLPPPDPEQHPSNYMEVVTYYRLGFAERIILILCLIPEVRPQLLDALFMRNETTQRGYTEFGGTLGMSHGGFIPTAETALFILAGSNIDVRNELTKIFTLDHFFFKHNMVQRIRHHEHEPLMSTTLSISREYLEYFREMDRVVLINGSCSWWRMRCTMLCLKKKWSSVKILVNSLRTS
ncbi:MAG: hypothetical protein AAGB22_09770, partial [Bacteroidota bacterium]